MPEDERSAPLRAALSELGLVRAESAPDSALSVPSGGFETYAASVRPSMRSPVRRERRIFAAAVEAVELCDASNLLRPDLVRRS